MSDLTAQTQAPWEVLGRQFVQQYYQVFDTNKDQIIAMYHPNAMMSLEDNQVQGHQAIKELIETKLRFEKIQHVVTKADCQPTPEEGVIVLVTGRLKTDDDPPHAFSQVFYVRPVDGSYFIFNDFFRLSIHDTA